MIGRKIIVDDTVLGEEAADSKHRTVLHCYPAPPSTTCLLSLCQPTARLRMSSLSTPSLVLLCQPNESWLTFHHMLSFTVPANRQIENEQSVHPMPRLVMPAHRDLAHLPPQAFSRCVSPPPGLADHLPHAPSCCANPQPADSPSTTCFLSLCQPTARISRPSTTAQMMAPAVTTRARVRKVSAGTEGESRTAEGGSFLAIHNRAAGQQHGCHQW